MTFEVLGILVLAIVLGVVLFAYDRSLRELAGIKKDKIDFRVGTYPIFGFKDSEPQRWELFVEAAKMADFIGCLPGY